jgi:hypothetical protein
MAAATDRDPARRIIDGKLEEAAILLTRRGYITMQALGNGTYRVMLTDAARQKGWPVGWRRYPPLRQTTQAKP